MALDNLDEETLEEMLRLVNEEVKSRKSSEQKLKLA